ncbi:PhoX family protein [Planktothrix agardhii]|uniref:PhoX family protein n=1 Tax=Planktothrix agardhii TaxID=1160 RepID=UPI002B1F406D|nr:alkaline phosphatase PhoX [Planktothrix agardhii]MEA5563033.1 alkaline phosphatase PhoX [Planktothrix agardhii UHCC 0887]
MSVNRRDFLLFLSAGFTTLAVGSCQNSSKSPNIFSSPEPKFPQSLPFKPIKGPLPNSLDLIQAQTSKSVIPVSDNSLSAQQIQAYSTYEVVDDLVLPEGFTYDVIATWGDKVGNSRFGYNNDYVSFISTGEDQGFLTVNFEYISSAVWLETYQQIIGEPLPLKNLQSSDPKPTINAFELPEKDPLRQDILKLSQEGLTDLGIAVISVQRQADGRWVRTNSAADRVISGLSGWENNQYLKATGPAVAVFIKKGQGYNDQLGEKIIGTFANCAGGTTPWGTVLSAEENFQSQVTEAVYPDGTTYPPSETPFLLEEMEGLGNVFGLAGNKYGWIVEVDPTNPKDYGTKHTWLGRYRHESVGIRVEVGQPLAFYSGCDRRSGHLYKFVSKGTVKDPQDKKNSQLLTDGMLYAAKFNPDGTGQWIPLTADTTINPDQPNIHAGGIITLPQRPKGGSFIAKTDKDIQNFKQQFKTLGDLYTGIPEEQQGSILIDAHLAASAVGATCAARPEDTEIAPDGSLVIAFTSGTADTETGGPNLQIFKSPSEEKQYEYGWVMRLVEDGNVPQAMTFRWEMVATGGEVAQGGLGFANPDNLAIDAIGNLWMVTDISTSKHNQPVAQGRLDKNQQPLEGAELLGLYGNNSFWFLPTSGEYVGQAFLFAIGPMDCELTGPFFTPDQKTLFIAVQHPGEKNQTRRDMATKTLEFALQTTQGEEFIQTRQVPWGSNWPSKQPNHPPKPSLVAIRRINSEQIVEKPNPL